ncbi:MAG: type 4a pilus biogenesis protein PilO, partial [Candidatus Binatia bacterium]
QKKKPHQFSTVSSLARESGLDILHFRQKPELLQDFYAEFPVEMLMKGTYSQLDEFFSKVGKLNRIVNVKDISMKTPVVTEGRVLLSTNCNAVTFRFLSEEERARIAAERAMKVRH